MWTVTATAKVKCLVHTPDRAFAISHHFSSLEKSGQRYHLERAAMAYNPACPLFCIISSREYRGRLEQSGLRLGQIG